MKRIILTTIFWIAYISLLCAQGNGTYHQFDLEVDGLTRQYTLYVPEGYDGTEEWPVVFLLHAFRGSVDTNQIKLYEMYLVADTAKFFIVYPQGLKVKNLKNDVTDYGWNLPDYWIAEHDDVEFINSIIDDLIAKPEFVINKNRIHSTGYSLGGRMSYYLALVLSNRIASVAGVAGQMSDTLINHICTPLRKISVLHMQGTNDFANPPNGDKYALPLEGVTEYWASVNGCDEIPDSTELEDINKDDSSTVTVFDYNNCDNGYEVLLYRINGGDHNWPGGWKDPDGPDLGVQNYDIHASVEIWNFFKRNPHPNPWVEIPDTAFLHALIEKGVDTNGDSLILYEEAEEITYLDVCFKDISDMTGIKAFVNLDTLKCNANQFTSLDVSACTALKYLYCPGPFPPDIIELLTSLNISGCTALKKLDIGGNELTSLDVSNNTSLTELYCDANQLTSLDVSSNSSLTTLACGGNQLTNLNVSNNTELGYLYLPDMPTLYEVCVWESFPTGVDLDITNSPNVCFQADCNGDCSIDPSDVTEESCHSGISLYPNPTGDIISIEIKNPDNATIGIYNISGKLVFSMLLSSKVENIDISGLSEGIYFVIVMQDNNVRIEKLIVF